MKELLKAFWAIMLLVVGGLVLLVLASQALFHPIDWHFYAGITACIYLIYAGWSLLRKVSNF